MEKIIINGRCTLIEAIKNGNNQYVKKMLAQFCEQDDDLLSVLECFIENGFITTSCSCGHKRDEWYDPIYVAVYVDAGSICKILNLICLLQNRLSKEELALIRYSFNYNATLGDANVTVSENGEGQNGQVKFVEYMFGLQIDLFEQSERRQRMLVVLEECICDAVCLVKNDKCGDSENIKINYNALYLINRFIHYFNPKTHWLNISFVASSLQDKFDLLFKKNENDNGVVERTIEYRDEKLFNEFEFLLNY